MKKQVPLSQVGFNDLMKFASAQQLEVTRGMNTDALRALIRTGCPGIETIELDVVESVAAEANLDGAAEVMTPAQATAHYRDDPKVTLMIPSEDSNGGSQPFPVCVNGEHILIGRDQDVTIPYRFFHALQNAMETVYTQRKRPGELAYDLVETQKRVVNYSIIEQPTRREIDEWRARTADIGRGDDAILIVRRREMTAMQPAY